jgi:hypothetical protein
VHTRILIVLAALAFLLPSVTAQTPFPTDKNSRLEELGDTLTVTGRMRIPRRLKIECLRAITIEGSGDDATLEISGKVKMRAATGGKIEFRDVWVELTPECKEITLAQCIFTGKGGIRPSPDGPSQAKINFEQVEIESTASLTIEATSGNILMDRCGLEGPLVIRGIPKSEKAKSTLTLSIYGSAWRDQQGKAHGILGGIIVEGIRDGTIRTCDMAGPEALFIDNKKLTFDGNNARADLFEFRNSANGKFGGLKITKTDFRTPKLVLSSPPQGKKAERLTLDKCYFGGLEDLDAIRDERLHDFENSESGVVAILRDVCAEPHNFAGEEE